MTAKLQAPAIACQATRLAKASFTDLAGQTQPLDQWRGKVLVVNFWATWCPPCLKEIPEFIRMQARYREQGLQFVGVAIDQPEKVAPFAEKMGFNYPVLIGALDAVELLRTLGNQHGGLPFTVVFDRSGTLRRGGAGRAGPRLKLSPRGRATSLRFAEDRDVAASVREISARWTKCAELRQTARMSPATTPQHILVLHGPNLNLLGTREPEHYGRVTLAEIDATLSRRADAAGVRLESHQSNSEGELVDRVQAAARSGVDFAIVNPAALTHTSVALRDALAAVRHPLRRGSPVQRVRPRDLPPSLLFQ